MSQGPTHMSHEPGGWGKGYTYESGAYSPMSHEPMGGGGGVHLCVRGLPTYES